MRTLSHIECNMTRAYQAKVVCLMISHTVDAYDFKYKRELATAKKQMLLCHFRNLPANVPQLLGTTGETCDCRE